MRQVQLGRTGVKVSVLCLGTMYFGSLIDEATAFEILDAYVEAGGSFLDTANIYAGWIDGFRGGESESLIGRWMKARHYRAALFIATKVGGALHRGHESLSGSNPGLRASQIEMECEKSLRRLNIDTIDLYYAHLDDRQTPLEETMQAFDRLVKAGKVRLIGASNMAAWRLALANGVSQSHQWVDYCCVQQRYSYLRPKAGANFTPQVAASEDLQDYCRAQQLTLLAYSPLLGGAYAHGNLPEQYVSGDNQARLAPLKQVALECGATHHQVVLAWLCQQGIIPVIGVDHVQQLEENMQCLNISLSSDQLLRLNAA